MTDSILRAIAPVTRGRESVVDLRSFRWIHPATLCGIAAIAAALQASGGSFRLLGPEDGSVANYAARMHLGVQLDILGFDHDLPVVRENDLSSQLLELSTLDDPDRVRALSSLVHNRVQSQNPVSADALWESMIEIGMNVRDHSEGVGFAAAQFYPRNNSVVFAISDSGVGLRSTLQHRGAVDDETAIRLALAGVSRFADEPDRGHGLTTALRHLGDCGGSLYLATGEASVHATLSSRNFQKLHQPNAGTLLWGEARLRSRATDA